MDMDNSSDSDCEPELRNDIEQLDRAIEEDSDQDTGDQTVANIDAALALNENVSCHFLGLEAMLTNRLSQCRTRLELVRNKIQLSMRNRNRNDHQYFKYSQCGLPYFRDKTNRVPPDNVDTIYMRRAGIINYTLMRYSGNGWSCKDKKNLQNIILEMSRQQRQRSLEEKLRAAERAVAPDLDELRSEVRKQIAALLHTTLEDVAFPIHQDYDWELIESKMQNRHTMGELRSMWRLYLHPQLTQTNFSRYEFCSMEAIARQRNFCDWDAIAHALGGHRSSYQCFVFYRSVMATKSNGTRWTEEEDEFLRQVVDCYRSGTYIPWATISTCIEGKKKMQIYNRYMNSVRPQLKKGKFLPEEDAVIMACVEKYGSDFNKVSQFLPHRTVVQLRLRYNLFLANNITAHWSMEEDQLLLRLLDSNCGTEMNGSNYANAAKHFPNKNRNHVRMRHVTLMKYFRANPNGDLRLAPRRKPRLIRRAAKVDLATAVEKLARRIERGEESPPPEQNRTPDLDRKLTNYFVNELTEKDAVPVKLLKSESREDTDNLRRILLLLKANIDKTRFTRDELGSKYIKLFGVDTDEVVKPVRTYSKQGAVYRGPIPGNAITVWSDTRTLTAEYVLPPNYDTVTACKAVMLKAHSDSNRRQLSLLRNPTLKAHYVKFLERCEILLTWPLVMSCIEPNHEGLDVNSIFNDNYDTSKDESDRKKPLPLWEPIFQRPFFVGRLKGYHSGKKKLDKPVTQGSLDLPPQDGAANNLVVKEDLLGRIVAIGEPDPIPELPEEGVVHNTPMIRNRALKRKINLVARLESAPMPRTGLRRSPRTKKKK